MTQYSYTEIQRGLRKEEVLLFKLHARFTSAPLAWLFYKCGISANGVTLLGMALALPSVAFNLTSHYYWAIAIFHIFFLLDGADGVLARGTNTTSPTGAYLDDVAHYVFHSLFFISLGLGLALRGDAVCGALAIATCLGNNLDRAHRDLVKVRGNAKLAQLRAVESHALSLTVRQCVLGTFEFPNILVYMTFLAWNLTLLKWYFAYCSAMGVCYLVYSSVSHVSRIRQTA